MTTSRGGETPARRKRRRRSERDGCESDELDAGTSPASQGRQRSPFGATLSPRGPPSPFSEYSRGNIVRLRMRSFLSFSDTLMVPGPRLNLILGPNGTGKSSVVSAVCIVFGGQLALLGRSSELSAYVRHGQSDAEVEICLYDPEASGGVRRVSRAFVRETGKSVYYIDGKRVQAADIDSLKKRYDIQLDNLSQFMPQEKIADFVQQTPKSLLCSTIRALGGTDKLNVYEELLSLDVTFENYEVELDKKQKSLATLVTECKDLEAEVEAYRKYQEIRQLIRDMKRFYPWTEHAEAQEVFLQVKGSVVDAEASLSRKREEAAALLGPLAEIERRRDEAWNSYNRDAKQCAKEKTSASVEVIGKVEALFDNLEDLKSKIVSLDKQVERRERDVETARKRLDDERKKLVSALECGNDEEDSAARSELYAKRTRLRQELSDTILRNNAALSRERDIKRRIHHLHEKSKALADVRSRRIRALGSTRSHAGVEQVAQWVADNQDRFRFPVFGPIVAEVDCESEFAACVLSQVLSGFALGAFVVQSKDDGDLLRDETKTRFGKPPAIFTPALTKDMVFDVNDVLHPERPVDDHLRSLGIDAVASDIFNAPPAVKSVLNAQNALHRLYVGNQKADLHMDCLVEESGVNRWVTPASTYNCVCSRYNPNARSTSVSETAKSPGILSGRMDDSERRAILREIAEEEGNLKAASAATADIEQEVRRQREEEKSVMEEATVIGERIKNRAKLTASVANAERHLTRIQKDNTVACIRKEQMRLMQRLADLEHQCPSMAGKLVDAMAASVRALGKMDEALAQFSSADRELTHEKHKHGDTDRELADLEKIVNQRKAVLRDKRNDLKHKMKEAENRLPKAEYLEREDYFKQFGFESHRLAQEIETKEEEARMMSTGGSGVLERYEQKKRSAAELEEQIREAQDEHESRRARFDSDKESFLSWLTSCIETMALRFSKLYQGFDCRGDIRLINEGSKRMKDLAIQILVSYRDDVELLPISPQGNSGGEKMACTMLYCFSLQAMEKTPPFIMVDELNQGLDPKNERYIMKIMLDDAERGSAPQSFVVTPKLILDLPVRSATVTHIIMNGSLKVPVLASGRS